MRNIFNSLLFLTLIVLFIGCNSDTTQKKEENKKFIKWQNSSTSFYPANDKLDTSFDRKKFYVPVYSHIYFSENSYTRLSITLSIRNIDQLKDLYIESIDYYNTEGVLVKQFLNEPHILKPLATVDYVVNLEDMSGGNGAKFIVNFASKTKMSLPIIQAIMINNSGNSNLSFLTEGKVYEN